MHLLVSTDCCPTLPREIHPEQWQASSAQKPSCREACHADAFCWVGLHLKPLLDRSTMMPKISSFLPQASFFSAMALWPKSARTNLATHCNACFMVFRLLTACGHLQPVSHGIAIEPFWGKEVVHIPQQCYLQIFPGQVCHCCPNSLPGVY